MVLGVSGQRPDGCLRVSSDHVIMFKSMFFMQKRTEIYSTFKTLKATDQEVIFSIVYLGWIG